jgi:hypothetical protein
MTWRGRFSETCGRLEMWNAWVVDPAHAGKEGAITLKEGKRGGKVITEDKVRICMMYRNDSGEVLLQPIAEIPASELWLFQNPEASTMSGRVCGKPRREKSPEKNEMILPESWPS